MNDQIQQLLTQAISGTLGMNTTSLDQNKHQRSPQIVNIISDESTVQVNIGNLLPNFYSFNQDMNLFYQIKSILLPTNFFNVKASDTIYFSCQITLTDLRTFTPITWVCTPTTFIQFEKDGYMNANEIIKQWNYGIQNKCQIFRKIIAQITNNFQLTHDELFYGVIMNHIQFSFDSGVMKMAMKTDFTDLDIPYPPEPLNWDPNENLDNFRQNFILSSIDYFHIYTGYGQTFKESGRIAKAMGMGYSDGFSTYYQPFFDVINYQAIQDSTTLIQSASFDKDVFNIQYGTNMCNVNRYDKIFIRTSLNTQNWNQNGQRSNVLAIIPFQQTVGMLPVQMVQSERTYNIKETPQSLSTFQIYFTDEDNELVEFNDNFMIELAFFFM